MAKKKKRNEGQNVLRIVWGVVGAGLAIAAITILSSELMTRQKVTKAISQLDDLVAQSEKKDGKPASIKDVETLLGSPVKVGEKDKTHTHAELTISSLLRKHTFKLRFANGDPTEHLDKYELGK